MRRRPHARRRPTAALAEAMERRVFLSVAPAGSEFRVNTFTAGNQFSSAVAADAVGNFVIVWQSADQDGGGQGVFAQRYNSAGAAQGAEFRVNTTTVGNQRSPAVASDADGDFVVAWASFGQDGSDYGIYAQRFNAAGAAQGGEFRVNTFTTGAQQLPSVAMDSDGDFVIAWQSNGQEGSGFEVYAQRYNAGGIAQGGGFRVNTFTASGQRLASAAMDAAGNFVVAWASNGRDGDSYGIYAQRYSASGTAQGGEFKVNTTEAGTQFSPSAAMDGDGDFVIAWESGVQDPDGSSGVYAQRFNAAGVAQGAEFRANTATANSQATAAVAADANGNFVISWQSLEQDGSSYGVYAQRYNAAGLAQGAEFRANTATANSQANPAVASNASGDFVVVWQSDAQDGSSPDSYGVYAQRYAASGGPTTLGIAPVNAVENAGVPPINLAAVFSDPTTAPSNLVYAVVANTNPGLFSSTPIASANLSLNVAANAAGASTLTVRATNAGGLFVETSFLVTVRPSWLTVPAGAVWSIAGTPTNYTLTLYSGGFVVPTDPSPLNPNLGVVVNSGAGLSLNADAHLANLTVRGGASFSFLPGSEPAPRPIPPRLSIGNASASEGDAGPTPLNFAVKLDRPAEQVTRVKFSTANQTAFKGSDYVPTGGVLIFQPGESKKTVTVKIVGDTRGEADETFRVVLYDADGAALADGTGVGTIKNDDTPRVTVGSATVFEGDKGLRTLTFNATLDRTSDKLVTLRYATLDGTAKTGRDYLAASGTLTFAAGEMRKRITVYVIGDKSKEADETFFVDLFSSSIVVARGQGVVRNDD